MDTLLKDAVSQLKQLEAALHGGQDVRLIKQELVGIIDKLERLRSTHGDHSKRWKKAERLLSTGLRLAQIVSVIMALTGTGR